MNQNVIDPIDFTYTVTTATIGVNFGTISNQVVETNSPIWEKNFNFCSREKIFIPFQYNAKYFNTPVFEPDVKKSASKSISLNILNDISNLKDNWNGYSAKPIPFETINLCRKIVILLNYQPEIYPTGRRTIQFEYEKADRSYLEFEISQDKIKVMEVPKRKYKNAKHYEIPSSNYECLAEIVDEFCGGIGEWENSTILESYIA